MARTILYCKDWLRFNLTGERLTDYTEASRHFLDVASGTISDALAERLGMADATALVPPINPADALGGRVDWIRSTLGLADTPWSEIEVEAEQAGPGSGGVLYLPYGSPGGERAPFQDTNASASWLGMSVSTTRQQILRAVYEGVAFSLIECVDVLGVEGDLVVSGGGFRSDLVCRILADATGRRVVRQDAPEAGARGAAVCVLVSAGEMPDLKTAAEALATGVSPFDPNPDNEALYAQAHSVYLAARDALRPAWPLMRELRAATAEKEN